MSKLPVIAAIPNYNMASELTALLPELITHGYDEIYVLDDASTDHSRDAVEAVSGVHFVAAPENMGAGATRNRIIPHLASGMLVHFLDADIEIQSDRTADRVRDIAASAGEFGFIGTLALDKDGVQSAWNYGPRQGLKTDIGANLQNYYAGLVRTDPDKAARFRNRFSGMLQAWPDLLAAPTRRETFWCIEQSLVFSSEVFKEIGGFREDLREHEIQDLAIRMSYHGLRRYFDPSIKLRHTEGDVRDYNRLRAQLKAEAKINLDHGLTHWLRGK